MAVSKSKSSISDRDSYRQLRDTIYTFFYYSNKPVNMSELILQFKGHPKKLVETVVDDLVQKNKIFMKVIGTKTKIYCLTQEDNYEIDEEYTDEIDNDQNKEVDDKKLRFFKWKNEKLKNELNELKKKSSDLDLKIAAFDNSLTTEELKNEIERMKREIESHDGERNYEYVDVNVFEKTKKDMENLEKELIKRKKKFKEMVEMISDGLEMKKKDLLTEAGIEDEF